MFREIWYAFCVTCRPNRSSTVRYAFPIIALAAIFAGTLAAVNSSDQSYIKIESSVQTVREGETFFVTVNAVANTPVNAVDIQVQFPELQMDVVGIDVGESVITLWAQEPYTENGIVHLQGGTFRKGFLGEHLIATIKARAKESGSAYITTDNVTFIAGDGEGTSVEVSENDTDSTKIYVTNKDGSLVGEATVQIVTDIDGDGDVDLKDISAFMAAWLGKGDIFDFNGDGRMTFRDFSILLADSFFR